MPGHCNLDYKKTPNKNKRGANNETEENLALCMSDTAYAGPDPCCGLRRGTGRGVRRDKTLAPYFFVQDAGQAADQFPLKDTSVSSTINGVIAETYVTQTYANEVQYPSMPATCSRHLPGLRYME